MVFNTAFGVFFPSMNLTYLIQAAGDGIIFKDPTILSMVS